MTASPSDAQRLQDLAWLRRVRDRIDREYAQPLDVEALARGVHMSAGHLSRQFKAAYGESPYSYLMTRRIERAMALLRRGDLSVTDVCWAVGCSSLGTFSTRFTELVGVPPSVYRRAGGAATAGMPPCVAKQVTQTDQESRSALTEPILRVSGMDISIYSAFLPQDDPDDGPGLLRRHARLRDPQRRRVQRHALDHGRSRPTSRARRSCCTRPAPTPASPTTSAARSPR